MSCKGGNGDVDKLTYQWVGGGNKKEPTQSHVVDNSSCQVLGNLNKRTAKATACKMNQRK